MINYDGPVIADICVDEKENVPSLNEPALGISSIPGTPYKLCVL